jgi:hypothetical protein
VLLVQGNDFSDSDNLKCNFGDVSVTAVVKTDFEIECEVPDGTLATVPLTVSTESEREVVYQPPREESTPTRASAGVEEPAAAAAEDDTVANTVSPFEFTFVSCPAGGSRYSLSISESGEFAYRCYLGMCLFSSDGQSWHLMGSDVFAILGRNGGTLFGLDRDLSVIKSTDGYGLEWQPAAEEWNTQCSSAGFTPALTTPIAESDDTLVAYLPPTDPDSFHTSATGDHWWLTDQGVKIRSTNVHTSGSPVTLTSKWDCACAEEEFA